MTEHSLSLTPDLQLISYTTPLLSTILLKHSETHLKILEHKNGTYYGRTNSQNKKQGPGILLYDTGDILIGNWRDDGLRGHFMYFGAGRERGRGWLYGEYVDERVEGWAYVYGRDHKAIKVVFRGGGIVEDCEYRDGKPGRTNINHQGKETNHHASNSKPKIKGSKQALAGSIHFKKPTEFLQTYLTSSCQQKSSQLIHLDSSSHQNLPQFHLFQIDSTQNFYGTLQNNKPSGIGIILVNEWPVCYGNFVDGQLEGLGRVEQTRAMVLDGIFWGSCLKVGWVVDEKEEITCFGTLVEGTNSRVFKFSQEYAGLLDEKIIKFRRRHHLQSLFYQNSHAPELFQKLSSQFLPSHFQYAFQPSTTLTQTPHEQNNFPSFISQISRINNFISPKSRQSAMNKDKQDERDASSLRVERDLVDLIREYNENKDNYDKTTKALSARIKDSRHDGKSRNYVKQNNIISYNPTLVPSGSVSRSRSIKNSGQKSARTALNDDKKAKNGNINNILRIDVPHTEKQRYDKQETGRKSEKRLDLQRLYNKYLKKQL